MLFDLHPKTELKELFGREKEVQYIREQIISKNWIIIGGQRGIGKTSVMKVAINELKKNDRIDGIYLNLRGVTTLRELLSLLISEINRNKLFKLLNVSVNFNLGPLGVELKGGKLNVQRSLLELLLSINHDLVIGLDEVQELSSVTKPLLDVLGNVFMSNPKVRFLFSGSYVGLVKALLNPKEGSPLLGRPPIEIKLRPFNKQVSIGFLKAGMEELNVDLEDSKAEEVVNRLDGVVGWLTLFGNNYAIRKLSFNDSLKITINEGRKLMLEELNHFLEGRNRELYLATLSSIKIAKRWKDIKFAVTVRLKREIDDKELSSVLEALVNYNFIEKVEEGEYTLVDPILREMEFHF
ncbi:ATPase [Sulfolobus sp. A20]|uniref:AAA family ATPase n=2 Tax=Sulfolobaceae TaxID=118883 RepID=UPI000845EC19|nr:ATP-binding protein [Sulfolobus sp. A20]TRM75829.1 ATP-binding protein [Sulfolobus sp. E5]TRM77451.1 ATP-binding protein [Sulfolobus sp. A20-N-F8]TRM81674.1 ATP-binding protein [Sulfolobus sp. D5]TRM84107.1 ATP-binding protein [Sulfolobus sp. A20-N-F6]TRM85305.1 ATP-binding protein [Sulfolobus sp. F3]TRM89235.1 ATP-binding protein [Sulfolobus sp. E3]TRN04023.1 ATP-binding protein [Sulfolobus sp. F1]TRN04845.1 ATP-binding protein [Sulfolobus sp. E1]